MFIIRRNIYEFFLSEPGVFTCSVCRLETTVSLYSPRMLPADASGRPPSRPVRLGDRRQVTPDPFVVRTSYGYLLIINSYGTPMLRVIRTLIMPDTRYLVIFTRYHTRYPEGCAHTYHIIYRSTRLYGMKMPKPVLHILV